MAWRHLNRGNLPFFYDRLDQLKEDQPPAFGKFSAHGMVAHMTEIIDLTVEGDMGKVIGGFKGRYIMKPMALYVLKWPKGKIKAPAKYCPPGGESFEDDVKALKQAMLAFVESVENDPTRISSHVVFGPMTMKEWQRLHGMHLDHHFCQFEV